MLSPNELKILIWLFSFFSKFPCNPFQWNDKGQLQRVRSNVRKYISVLEWITQIVGIGFLGFRILDNIKTKHFTGAIANIYLLITIGSSVAFKSTVWIYPTQFVQLVNGILYLNKTWGKNEILENGATFRSRIREAIFVIIILCTNMCIFAVAILFLVVNYNILQQNPLNSALSLPFFLLYLGNLWTNLNFTFPSFMMSLFSLNFWLRRSCEVWPKVSGEKDMRWKKSFVIYRSVQILNGIHNVTFGRVFVPLYKLMVVSGILVSSYSVIKLKDILHPVLYCIFVIMFFTTSIITMPCALIMSNMYDISMRAGKNFNENYFINDSTNVRDRSGVILRKQLRSMPLIRSDIGIFYAMEGIAKLTLCDQIGRGIGSMLVTFNQL